MMFFLLTTGNTSLLAQVINNKDSVKLKYPIKERKDVLSRFNNTIGLKDPVNIRRKVEYDPTTNTYEITETVGGRYYRLPQRLTFAEYQKYQLEEAKQNYWLQKSGQENSIVQSRGILPKLDLQSKALDNLFGSSVIDIRPQGFAEINLSERFNKNENPLFNERQRSQSNLDFDERIQLSLVGQIGDKLKINTNFNTQAQFDFENQIKFEYTGKEDEIIRKIEVGNVSMPLYGSLITGSQSLFGIKSQLQFGKLGVTSVFSQQKSQVKEISISNGAQENEYRFQADAYDANRHYFLSTYFRDNYDKALRSLPTISSGIMINKIEVWITNKTNNNTDSRDIIAFIDLGENKVYNNALFQGGAGYASNPSGFNDPTGTSLQSNNILNVLPPNFRNSNDNTIGSFFLGSGGGDNYAKLTYARKLTEREFKFDPVLGYISLNQALNNDEVLAVAYRYTLNGVEYQVGEFSTDVPLDPARPKVLYTKLLKNETLKTSLPTWDLMMKNIYSLNAYQISPESFRLEVFRLDESSGVEQPVIAEGVRTKGKPFIQLLNLDRLNSQQAAQPDGVFDFVNKITINTEEGRIIFPVVEPFGKNLKDQFEPSETNLIKKYVFQQLYDSTRYQAQQFPEVNKYFIKGYYKSNSSSEFNLNAINIPQGSVIVTAGTTPLIEGADFTVDYNLGRVKILNEALLNSSLPLKIRLETTELFGLQSRSLMGTRLDYVVNDHLNLGGTLMQLSERPLTQKVNIGDESISNTIYGFDATYRSEAPFLTKFINKLPLIQTKEASSITFTGEFAQFLPGHARALNFDGEKGGISYLDDFENSKSIIDLKNVSSWFISSTPQLFPEASLVNNRQYGFNRALLSFYTIDPVFYSISNSSTPENIRTNKDELSSDYVRQVTEQEVFPNKQSVTGQPLLLPTFDLAYYPKLRGPYNYTTSALSADGSLLNPKTRWGGIFRRLDQNDFEALNVEFIEFWVMDPFSKNQNSTGGDLYFNLGSVSEDILKDGAKSVENALPADGDANQTNTTVWGRVGKQQPVTQAFDNDPTARQRQDVGLDGVADGEEKTFFADYLNQLRSVLPAGSPAVLNAENDPSGDNFVYYRGPQLDAQRALILERYKHYNGTEGNSRTSEQSRQLIGIENAASTPNPDGEDVNRDNNSSTAEEYYQYKVSMRKQDLVVGQNFVNDMVTTKVKLDNGKTTEVTWYQFKVPIQQFQSREGGIQDFKSIRFIRMFMTGFEDSVILRFAKLQLLRGEWRKYNAENNPARIIKDPALPPSASDNSTADISTINIEENGNRTPIPYVLPPGIQQEVLQSAYRENVKQNEQSLVIDVKNLADGFARGAYKNINFDFRSYKTLKMFVHAEGPVSNDDVHAFLRLGTDYNENYYEYDIPLQITPSGATNANVIWPDANNLNIDFALLQNAKRDRNAGEFPINKPYYIKDGKNLVTVLGQPDLSKVRVMMVGIRNPAKGTSASFDDGLEKSAQIWVDELRITNFEEKGGWAATGILNMKMADFANVTVAGSKSTFGFGSLDKRIGQVNRTDNSSYDVSANMELGKLLPPKLGITIPLYVSYSQDIKKPQYSPISPDLLLSDVLRAASRNQRDSLAAVANDVTTRRSINFTNVRKNRAPEDKVQFYDIENFNFTYAYTEFSNRSYTIQNNQNKTHKAIVAYNFQKQSRNFKPFDKILKSEHLALIRDINLNLFPQVVDVQWSLDRFYNAYTLRATETSNFFTVPSTYNKNYFLSGLYNVGWDLSSSMKMDYSARSLASIDEPNGPINSHARDSITSNLMHFGRPVEFSQRVGVTYNVPINKMKFLSFTSMSVRYAVDYNWRTEALVTLMSDTSRLGNTIQNARTVQLNGQLNFAQLFGKSKWLKDVNPKQFSVGDVLKGFLTMIKNVSGTYSLGDGTFLPGYLPRTSFFAGNPGLGFMLGSQSDIRYKVASQGQLTTYSGLNASYIKSSKEDLNYRAIVEPIKDFRIELSGTRGFMRNDQSNFRFDDITNTFTDFSPVTTGLFNISTIALNTAFDNESGLNNVSKTFIKFQENRIHIAQRLAKENPNSSGPLDADGYPDGYGKAQQEVIVNAFLSAYLGKDPDKASLKQFPSIPLPNWRITYNGLSRLELLKEIFSSISLNHSYRSLYTIANYNSLLKYMEDALGKVQTRDVSNNFLPKYQVGVFSLSEDFLPLIGLDFRFRNNMTANLEWRKSRLLSYSTNNSQMAQLKDRQIVFGFGYRTTKFKLPFRVGNTTSLNNDLNFKLDFALRGNKTVIYRTDDPVAQIAGGTSTLSLRPSIDYVMNQRLNFKVYFDRNVTKPETSNTYQTSFSNFGVGLRFTL
ncbi:T9SS outer membrane translocon Sov/SprA [Solitalea koreensis]|uniref:Cell surface protein SprA n=2 Tax=Solitalea koreensis TaxID=543615 RepID=A0A521CRJ8_9SPHI|nr:cell surface protein SprA [Solitalea koreensis]